MSQNTKRRLHSCVGGCIKSIGRYSRYRCCCYVGKALVCTGRFYFNTAGLKKGLELYQGKKEVQNSCNLCLRSKAWLRKMYEEQFCFSLGEGKKKSQLWATSFLLLPRVSVRNSREAEEFAFTHYMECLTAMGNVDAFLKCNSVACSDDGKVNHNVDNLRR